MKDLTVKQKAALKSLEESFKRCKAAGLSFCGMDADIYYASDQCMKSYANKMDSPNRHSGSYHEIAQCQNLAFEECDFRAGRIDTSGAYKESGGW